METKTIFSVDDNRGIARIEVDFADDGELLRGRLTVNGITFNLTRDEVKEIDGNIAGFLAPSFDEDDASETEGEPQSSASGDEPQPSASGDEPQPPA